VVVYIEISGHPEGFPFTSCRLWCCHPLNAASR